MTEGKRREEYSIKAKAIHVNYQSDFESFMERRKNYTKLDQGVREEQELRKQYLKQMEELANEYKDILTT